MATAMPVLQVGSCPVPSHGEHWACVQGKAYVCILCSFYNSFSYLYVCVCGCVCLQEFVCTACVQMPRGQKMVVPSHQAGAGN